MPKHRRFPRVASGASRRREGAREMTTQVTKWSGALCLGLALAERVDQPARQEDLLLAVRELVAHLEGLVPRTVLDRHPVAIALELLAQARDAHGVALVDAIEVGALQEVQRHD